jgi:hypothetical protein
MAATWLEVDSSTPAASTTAPSVEQSLTLLQATFPGRYDEHKAATIRNKMAKTRQHTSGKMITSLRIWSHFDSGTVDITLFFFLRLQFCPECWVMTAGSSVTDGPTLYKEILSMVGQAKTHPQVQQIEILNVGDLPADIQNATATSGANALGQAFSIGLSDKGTITRDMNTYTLGLPWAKAATPFIRWHC